MQRNLQVIILGFLFVMIVIIGSYYWYFAQREMSDAVELPDIIVPNTITIDGQPVFINDRVYFSDYNNVMHGISAFAMASNPNELGHENYRDDLYLYDMEDRGELWLRMVQLTERFFGSDGRFTESFRRSGEAMAIPSGTVSLADYANASFAHHMYHNADKFASHGLEEAVSRVPAMYVSSLGRYVIGHHYKDGAFFHGDGTVDNESMGYGLAAVHGHFHAWIRHKMHGDGMDEGELAFQLGHSAADLLRMARDISVVLERHWNPELNMYDFGDGPVWKLDAIGALLRGKKALYEMLYLFGDDADKEKASVVFERSAVILEQLLPLTRPWGLPDAIGFTATGCIAASDEVDLYAWYHFLNHLGGGFGWLREPEGTARFIDRNRPALRTAINEMTDGALKGAVLHHFRFGRMVTSVRYEDGGSLNDDTNARATAMFLASAANLYRDGGGFAEASRWGTVPEDVARRSRQLYDIMLAHVVLLERQFIIDRTKIPRDLTPREE